jgi:5,10-methylenetetrahydromethanopterin reductase
MRVGVFIGDATGRRTSVDELLAGAREAEAAGFSTAWVPHIPWSLDAMTALALASTVTSTIELGTAVVPTFPRHPLSLAQEALSVQAVSGGRLALGIGPSHPVVIEKMYGLSYDRPAAHTREYVEVLQACFRSNQVDHDGDRFSVHSMLEVPGASEPALLVAALAPQMLRLTGELADGTITYWADERAIGEHVVPAITGAAVGRPAPRVVAGIPVSVVDDVDAAREKAARVFAAYEHIPTYQRILDRGSSGSPVDVAIIGDEATVRRRIQAFADAGATDLCAAVADLGEGSRTRTVELLASLA